MNKYIFFSAILCGVMAIGIVTTSKTYYKAISTAKSRSNTTSPAENYAMYCSGCHGEKMDAFTDRQWKHGNKLNDLMKAIKKGYANEGMPAFAETFTDTEINELANYILKGIKNVEAYNFDNVPVSDIFKSEKLTIKAVPVVTGIDVPWGMAFLPDGSMLVTDRQGKLYRVKNKNKQERVIVLGAFVNI